MAIKKELKWQWDIVSNPQKIKQFQDVVGALHLQKFKTYLFVKPSSAFVTVIHSPMKFVAISVAMQCLQGRFIGFVGDQTIVAKIECPNAVLCN
jgi:hypothetical protein